MLFTKNRAIFLLFILIGLSSCATVPPPPASSLHLSWADRKTILQKINHWQLKGKIALRTNQDSGSATFDWQQRGNRYAFSLFGPLGTSLLKLDGSQNRSTAYLPDGKTLSGASPEELLAKGWGFQLPVSYLNYWVRGLAVPGISASPGFDSDNRLTHIQQQQWQVHFQSYTRSGNVDLPTRINITSPALKAKIIIYSWGRS